LAISTVETSTPVGCRGAAPRRDAEGGEQNQNDGGRGWFVKTVFFTWSIFGHTTLIHINRNCPEKAAQHAIR